RLGFLLQRELQQAIKASRVLVLLWSKEARRSSWVRTELLTAFHLNRFIVPCLVDGTRPPQFLGPEVGLDLRRKRRAPLHELMRAVREAPRRRNQLLPLVRASGLGAELVARSIQTAQDKEIDAMEGNLRAAARMHAAVEKQLLKARKDWPYDLDLINE